MIVVKKIEPSLMPGMENAVFECTENEVAQMGTLMGDKYFYMEKGDRVRMRVWKSDCLEAGDKVNLSWLVMKNQDKFNWQWDFPPRLRSNQPSPNP